MKRVYLTKPHLRDALEQRADTVVGDITTFIQVLDYYTQPKRGFALVDRGVIYGAFGLAPVWKGVAEAWLVPTIHIKSRKVSASRHMRNGLDQLISELKVHRAQAAVKVGHEEAHRLVRFVGMEQEGLMHRYGPDGSDYVRYAKWHS